MNIGIYLKGDNLSERFVNIVHKIIKQNNEIITRSQITKDPTLCRIETDKSVYKLVGVSNNARGYRFHKVYIDANTTVEELDEYVIANTIINRDGNSIEMIKEE